MQRKAEFLQLCINKVIARQPSTNEGTAQQPVQPAPTFLQTTGPALANTTAGFPPLQDEASDLLNASMDDNLQ